MHGWITDNAAQEGLGDVDITFWEGSCGGESEIGTVTSGSDGYYALAGLTDVSHSLMAVRDNCTFDPALANVEVPQNPIAPVNITAECSEDGQ